MTDMQQQATHNSSLWLAVIYSHINRMSNKFSVSKKNVNANNILHFDPKKSFENNKRIKFQTNTRINYCLKYASNASLKPSYGHFNS